MFESSFSQEGLEVVTAAEGVLRSWQGIHIVHGRLPGGVHDSVRRICHRVGLKAAEEGRAFHYSFSEERIEFSFGPPDAAGTMRELLDSLSPYVTEDWKIFSGTS